MSEVPYASRSQNAIPCCGDGPDAADLGIDPAKLSDPAIRVETDGDLGHFAAWELYRNFGDRFR